MVNPIITSINLKRIILNKDVLTWKSHVEIYHRVKFYVPRMGNALSTICTCFSLRLMRVDRYILRDDLDGNELHYFVVLHSLLLYSRPGIVEHSLC